MLACAGANHDGAASLEKQVGKVFGLSGALSKFHSRVFWLRRGERMPPDHWDRLASLQPVGDGSWLSQPGIFSWDRIDQGSALLARHVPGDIAGRVADFGCGWGYLARQVLANCPAVAAIDLIDAEHRALEAARANITDRRATFHWLDLATERRRQPTTPSSAIRRSMPAASPSLPWGRRSSWRPRERSRPRGRLYMVANRRLPYDAQLKASFSSFETLADNNKFRVTCAVR